MSTLTQFFGTGGGGVPSNAIPIELLVVAGGGGSYASSSYGGGGGGAGRLIHIQNLYVLPSVSYTVTIGAGGASVTNGNDSSFGSLISAVGGGGTTLYAAGKTGGSGAGGTCISSPPYNGGGNVPSVIAFYNNDAVSDKIYSDSSTIIRDLGHNGSPSWGTVGGGGGGAGGAALYPPASNAAGGGGPGISSVITGAVKKYAFGGDGANNTAANRVYSDTGYGGEAGAANSGSGGGSTNTSAYSGGSGVVVVAYSNSYSAASTTGSPATPTRSGFRVYEFTGSGSITFA